MSAEDVVAYSDESDTETDEEGEDISNLEEPAPRPTMNTGRRGTVVAAPLQVEEGWQPPVYEKTVEQTQKLRSDLEENVLFKSLGDREFEIVLAAFQEMTFAEGHDIIRQGAEGDLFYVVSSGTCDIFVNGSLVSQVGPGQSFGELALLYDAPRAATVRASSPCTCWALDRVTFKMILMDTTMKRRDLYKSFINTVPILSTLTEYERLTIADALQVQNFSEGDLIIQEGSEGNTFYIIESGEVMCTKDGVEGEVSRRLRSGDYFGEIALLKDEARQATVTAVENTDCLVLDRSTFKRLLGPIEESLRRNMEVYSRYITSP